MKSIVYSYSNEEFIEIVKNAVAFGVDTITMLIGLGITQRVAKYWK